MKRIKQSAMTAVLCVSLGCSQNRLQVREATYDLSSTHRASLHSGAAESVAVRNPKEDASSGAAAKQPQHDGQPPQGQEYASPGVRQVSSQTDRLEGRDDRVRQAINGDTRLVPQSSPNQPSDLSLQLDAPALKSASSDSDSAGTLTVSRPVSMSLADLESLAFTHNPSIRELAATTQKAAGFRHQVGLRANPVFGYQGQQLADQQTDQHLAFVEQEFVTGDKLALNRRVLNEAVRAQTLELDAQRLRVVTDIRVTFYEALAAQKRVQLISDFQSVTEKAIEVAELRVRAAEGTRIDVLQATVQKNEIDLALQQAEIQFAAAWRQLSAIAGVPNLEPMPLTGELPRDLQQQEWNSLSASIVASSPEYRAALTRVSQARAQLQRHGVQAQPNLIVQLAAGVDNSTNHGMMNVQIAAPVPLFNKNQGNICAAQAEFCRATLEAQRIEKSIESRVASVSQDYDSALAAVTKYSEQILPNAAESLELAEQAYEAGETNFLQVLVARRTYFDSNLQFVQAQALLAQASSKVDGYLLTGALDEVTDRSGDDSLRDLTFSQQ